MSPELVPNWIKQEIANQELESLRASADAESNAIAELIIKAEAPEFWRKRPVLAAYTVD
jgi:hypothetical protein